jgi:hypothetical protein
MNSRRALFIAACLIPFAASLFATRPAAAQFQPPPQQEQPAASPWDQQPQQPQPPQQAPWSQQQMAPPQQQQQTQQICFQDFMKLRDAAQARATAIRTAGQRKAQAKEACGLFNAFSDAELKMIKFASDNAARCGIPSEIVTNLKQNHTKTAEIRTRVCQAAASPQGPAAPSLSDALSAPVPNASNIKTGRGTYDTLTGTPLGSK